MLAQSQSISAPIERNLIKVVVAPGKTLVNSPNPNERRYTGSVRLEHRGMLLFCDRAIHQLAANKVDAGGHVLLVHDSVTIKSDSVLYDGVSQQLTLLGHVMLQDRTIVLTTTRLEYNLSSGLAQYSGKSRVVDGRTVLTGTAGSYTSRTRQVTVEQPGSLVATRSDPTPHPSAAQLVAAERTPVTPVSESANNQSVNDQFLAVANTPEQISVGNVRGRQSLSANVDGPTATLLTRPTKTDRKATSKQVTFDQPTSNLSPTMPPKSAWPTVQSDHQPLPVHASIYVGNRYVDTYAEIARPVKQSAQTVRATAQAAADESDLERLLNRKRRIH